MLQQNPAAGQSALGISHDLSTSPVLLCTVIYLGLGYLQLLHSTTTSTPRNVQYGVVFCCKAARLPSPGFVPGLLVPWSRLLHRQLLNLGSPTNYALWPSPTRIPYPPSEEMGSVIRILAGQGEQVFPVK